MPLCRHDLFRAVLGVGIAIGLWSECFFVGLVFAGSGLWLEVVLLIAAGIAVVAHMVVRIKETRCRFCEAGNPDGNHDPDTTHDALARWLACAFGLLLVADLLVFGWASARTPRGSWDAWAIWNLRAHFLFRQGGVGWRDGFTEVLAWSHPDYPLLLPAFVAGLWKLLGRESRVVPVGVGCFFTFGSLALMGASVTILRGARQGLLAGIALAATPVFYIQGAMQCADVPVAFFRLSALAAVAVADRFDNPRFAVLAGAAAALDGWVKNEGLLWFGAFFITIALTMNRRLVALFTSGALPVLAPIVLFKARVATSSDIFGAAGRAGMMARALDPSRYGLIASEALKHLWTFGPLMVSPFVLLAVYLAVAGVRKENRDRAVIRAGVLAWAITAAGYCAIYLLRPLDLRWLLDTSSDRLILQLWPGLVFLTLLSARAPALPSGPSSDL